MTPEQKAKLMKKKPWLFCRKCQIEIKSSTGYCYDCYEGKTFTASPYGLVNTGVEFRLIPSERRMK